MKGFQAIFIATGSHTSTRLGIAGEDSGSVMSGLDFLRDIHLGKKVPLGKKVAVIGGGNTAIDAARLALRLGAKPFILYRRTPGEMPAIKSEVIQAEKEGIEISYLTSPTRIIPQGNRVTTLECVKNRSGPPDASGKKTLIEIKDSHFQIEADNIISAIGEVPDISILPEEIDVKNQLIVTDESLKTTMNGIFAGGDVKSPLRSIAHAIGSGKRAAISIDRYLKAKTLEGVMDTIRIGDGPSLSMRSYLKRDDPSRRKSKEVVRFRDINIDYFEQSSRHAVQTLSIDQSISSNKEVHLGFPCETALQEANRCFSCGVCNHCDNCYIFCSDLAVIKQKGKIRNTIDYDHCKGCGVCAEECPRDCIYMEREEK